MKLILGVTGSVAAKLTTKLVSSLLAEGHEVKVVTTTPGLYFFEPLEVRALGVEVLCDKTEWTEGGYIKSNPIPHIDLGDWADLLLIAPATYNTIGKIAHGLADNFLCCIAAAWPVEKPVVIAPAMNPRMWGKPALQHNLRGIMSQNLPQLHVVEPVEGPLACGGVGMGAMARILSIVDCLGSL